MKLPPSITRLEVIDERGLKYARWQCKLEASLQDQERTLKIFVSEGQVQPASKKGPRASEIIWWWSIVALVSYALGTLMGG